MRIRFKTRTIMILTCIAAVLLALPGELRLRRERRDRAWTKVYLLDHAAIHERLRADCVASAGRAPYDPISREWACMCARCAHSPKCKDWDSEADWHAGLARSSLERAAINERLEESVRRRLILPVIFDIRSSNR